LCIGQSGHEDVEVGWDDVADGDYAQIGCGGGMEGEACAGGVRALLFLQVRSALKDREWRRRTCPEAYNNNIYPDVVKTLASVMDGTPKVQSGEVVLIGLAPVFIVRFALRASVRRSH
jgi:hypothetical protein